MSIHPTLSTTTAIAKLIRVMPFVLSAVCAGAAIAKFIS